MVIVFLLIQIFSLSNAVNITHHISYRSFRSSVDSEVIYSLELSPISSSHGENHSNPNHNKLIVICTSEGMSKQDISNGLVQCMDDSKQSFVIIDTSGPELVTGFILNTDKGHTTEITCKLNSCFCRQTEFNENAMNNVELLSPSEENTTEEVGQRKQRALVISEQFINSLGGDLERLDVSVNRTFYVPVLVFVDSRLIRKFCAKQWPNCCPKSRIAGNYTLCREIRSYYLNVMAATTRLYADIDNDDIKIVLSVISIEAVTETKQNISYFDRFTKPAQGDVVDVNTAAREANRVVRGDQLYADSAAILFFMGHNLAGESGTGTIGGAYSGQVCSLHKTAVIEERFGYSSFFTVTHELAHVLGSVHDGKYADCGSTENQLMGWTFNKGKPELAYAFSCCSLALMYSVMSTKACTFSKPRVPEVKQNVTKYLGELISREDFCQLTNGGSFTSCPSDFSCKGVQCRRSRDTNVCDFYVGNGLPTMNGAICESNGNKWCMHGVCVPKNQTRYSNEAQKTCDVTARPVKPAEKVPTRTFVMKAGQIFTRSISLVGFVLLLIGVVIFSRENNRRRNQIRAFYAYPDNMIYAGQTAAPPGAGVGQQYENQTGEPVKNTSVKEPNQTDYYNWNKQ